MKKIVMIELDEEHIDKIIEILEILEDNDLNYWITIKEGEL